MRAGQRIQMKPTSNVARERGISPGAEGVVICSYNLLGRSRDAERVDVRFSPEVVVWGISPEEVEVVSDRGEAA